jgi:uncharacterized protein (TIGR03435 family)
MNKAGLWLATVGLMWAQSPAPNPRPEFEVASVKPTGIRDGSFAFDFPPGGRFTAKGVTVHNLLRTAYSLQDYQVQGGPGWMDSAGFDIDARPVAGTVKLTREQVLKMLQALIEERFHLAHHVETRQLPVYNLVVDKNGPKLQPAAADALSAESLKRGDLVTKKMSMGSLTQILAFDLKRPVMDQTGLNGEFAFRLEWARDLGEGDAGASPKPSLLTAVQEQLGLRLESAKGPVEVFVIDQVEKPTEN